jgi:hypothetical protein
MRRVLGMAVLAAAAGLFAGCQSAATPNTASSGVHTVATIAATTTTTSPATGRGQGTGRTLAACGAMRDPFDPTGTPPPPGSPARC